MQVGHTSDPSAVVAALRHAADATGTDFHYLLGTAMRESSLKPAAQSSSSSATGLFQFVDQTWLGLVKNHGAKYGLGSMADAITQGNDGRYRAGNDTDRHAILELRKNPQVASLMAGEYSSASAASLKTALGREVCGGELYAAHFLGAEGACKLIRAKESQPGASAAALLPAAASSNKSVFFHADGSAKSVSQVYDWAMRQPGAGAPVRQPVQVPEAAPHTALFQATNAQSANIEALLASVMNWQPSGNFFAPRQNGQGFSMQALLGQGSMSQEGPSSPLKLSAGLLGILSEGQDS